MIESDNSGYQSLFLQKLGYLFVASLAFSYVKFFGHLILFECIIAVLIPLVLMLAATRSIKLRVNRTDILVLAFAFFSLIPVSTGIDSLYESASYYRHMVLVPTLVYFLIRFLFRQICVLDKSILALILAACFQVISIIVYYVKTGQRPQGAFGTGTLITTSMLGAFAILYLSSNLRRINGRIARISLVGLLLFLFSGLIISMTRVAVIGVLMIPLLVRITFSNKAFQRLFLLLFVFGTVFLLFVSFLFHNPTKGFVQLKHPRDIDRLSAYESYRHDAKQRLNTWGYLLGVAIEYPLFGRGAFAYRYTRGGVSSAHNIFISSFMTSGLFGLTILLILIISTFSSIFSIHSELPILIALRNFVFSALTMTILIGMTNDFTGARVNFFFLLVAYSASLNEFVSHKTSTLIE